MPQTPFKNTWGSKASQGGLDQQRSDLFYCDINIPASLNESWASSVSWAVEKVTFPARSREAVAVKYLNQTNYQIGADTGSDGLNMTIRYAFNQDTAKALEKWHWLISNPQTGSVALTSYVKTDGNIYWLVPDMSSIASGINSDSLSSSNVYKLGGHYRLEGCWIKEFKPSDADMTTGTGLVTYDLQMQIDRYYPLKPSDMKISVNAADGAVTGGSVILSNTVVLPNA
jgi:hypothetical protein